MAKSKGRPAGLRSIRNAGKAPGEDTAPMTPAAPEAAPAAPEAAPAAPVRKGRGKR